MAVKRCQSLYNNFLIFNWMGKELQSGSLFVMKFYLLSDSIGIYDSKYPNTNNNVENSVSVEICG